MDWTYIDTLLSVIHQAAGAGPKFAGIVAKASAELLAYMESPEPAVPPDEPEGEPEEAPTDRRL